MTARAVAAVSSPLPQRALEGRPRTPCRSATVRPAPSRARAGSPRPPRPAARLDERCRAAGPRPRARRAWGHEVSAANGRRPREQALGDDTERIEVARRRRRLAATCSGEVYDAVPRIWPGARERILERHAGGSPKSATAGAACSSSSRLLGFTSLCTTPRSWAASSALAAARSHANRAIGRNGPDGRRAPHRRPTRRPGAPIYDVGPALVLRRRRRSSPRSDGEAGPRRLRASRMKRTFACASPRTARQQLDRNPPAEHPVLGGPHTEAIPPWPRGSGSRSARGARDALGVTGMVGRAAPPSAREP